MNNISVHIDRAGYIKKEPIINHVLFSMNNGELVGLIGLNGSGKSTTIKGILGMLPYFEGEILFAEKECRISYIPEQPVLYEGLTLWEHIEIALAAYNSYDQDHIMYCERLLKQFRLNDKKHMFPTSFSKGMQQKVMLIIGFMMKSSLYIIDEPFIGLDPLAIKELLSLIDYERERGATILMSTHILDSAERLCDRFVIINYGKIIFTGTLKELRINCEQPNGSLNDCFHSLIRVEQNEHSI